ncbi:unnamed protein product [Triticum turgidum subsp. durum]|uniref:Ubiquitin-like protease family profile domain-containing protein n=1 Tax=Triticum turgidum subsp. durum TaxID=4567 RepID=A0A9R1QKR9_TRITD|nr:unnamed protein product [Triticum turgidum subsp. durum]
MSSIGRGAGCANGVDAAVVALAKVLLINCEGSDGDAGISSSDVNNLIMHSCRDINAEHVAPNYPLPCNLGVPPNVEPCRASVDAHERKKRLRLPKGVVDSSNVTSNSHVPDACAGVRAQVVTSLDVSASLNVTANMGPVSEGGPAVSSSQGKRRVVVAKIKNGLRGTHPTSGVASKIVDPSPRRSPRIASGPVVDRVYPSVKLDGKHVSFEGSEDGGGCRGPSVDGTGLDGNNVVPRKRRPKVVGSGPKKKVAKSTTSNAGACDRINVTVRYSLGEVSEVVALLETRHKDIVCKAGFGCVFDWVLKGNVSRLLMCHLMKNIDMATMRIDCGPNKVLVVSREIVHQCFWFPMGDDTAPRPADSGHDELMGRFKAELGFSKASVVDMKDLRTVLKQLVVDESKDVLAVKNEDVAFKVQKSSNAMEDDGVFEKIDEFLQKVNELAAEVPTTSDRLSCIAGIFPEDHGPREESMMEATERDVAIIGSLRSATSHIRTAFNHLKKKQDVICKGFENDARIIVSQISKQKNDASAPVRDDDYTGQRGEEISKQKNDASAPVRDDDYTGQRGEEVVVDASDNDEDDKQEPSAESPLHDFSDDYVIDDDCFGGDPDGGCNGVDDNVDYTEGVFAPDQPVAEGDCHKSNELELGQQFHACSVDISEGKQVGFDCQGGASVCLMLDRCLKVLVRVYLSWILGDDVNHAASFEGKQVPKDTNMPESIGAGGDVFSIPVCEVPVVDGARASNKDAKPAVVSELLNDAAVVDSHQGGDAHASVAGPEDASGLNASHVIDKSIFDGGASAPATLSGNHVQVPEGLAAKLKDIISKSALRGNYSNEPQPEVEPNVDEVSVDGASEETDSDDLGLSVNEIDSSQTVSSFTQTPATPEAVQRMKDLYFVVMRLRKDKNKKDEVLFENAFCKATVKQVAESFRVGGMLNTTVAAQSIWKGSFDNRHLIRFFSAYADEPLDKKDIVLLGVFDPPATREDLGLDEPKFSLFESQYETPEIQVISDDEILKSVQAVEVKKGGVESKSKGVACAVPKAVDRGVESDDDSFMPPAPKKCLRPIAASPIKVVVKSPLVLSDDDDFVLRGERTMFTRSKSMEEPLYLLEIDPYHRPVDEDGQELPRPPFNVKLAAQKFKLYIKENLLAANLIMLPYWNRNHFTLYTMNKHRESLDIHDSWRYTGRNLSRNRFHGERVEIMSRMSLLMKEVYGEATYNSSRQPHWEHLVDRCSYAKMPEQGVNECGFYMLKAAYLYDGTKIVEEVKKRDPHSAYWKAECLFMFFFTLVMRFGATSGCGRWLTLLSC